MFAKMANPRNNKVCKISSFCSVGGKKKKKDKGKRVALNEFLADTTHGGTVFEPPKRTTSWADATDDIDPSGKY